MPVIDNDCDRSAVVLFDIPIASEARPNRPQTRCGIPLDSEDPYTGDR